tara:strand:+ start:495722 stop:496402 length:681 start_codon:yes stop_codon:yes gene_type:complete
MSVELSVSFIRNSIKYAELIAALAGTFYYFKYQHTAVKLLLPLLWLITITEFVSLFLISNDLLLYTDAQGTKYNLWIVNLLYVIYFPVLLYIYFKEIKNTTFKVCIQIFTVGYLVVSAINWIFIQNFITEWSELPFIVGSLAIIIAVVFYFVELLKSDKIIVFHRTLLFWVSIALLLFHAGTIPFSIKINGYAHIPGTHQLFLILYVLAILMYLILAFGFIWSRKE